MEIKTIIKKQINAEIDPNGRIWYHGMRYFPEDEIYGEHLNEHPEEERAG